MKLLTVQIEAQDHQAEEAFASLVEELAVHIVSADKETLTVRLQELPLGAL